MKKNLDNEIVGYGNGKAIVKDCMGDYYYVEREEEFVRPGDFVETEYLRPISELSEKEQQEIQDMINK